MAKLRVTLMVLASFLVAPPAMADKATASLVDPTEVDGKSGITAELMFIDNRSKLMVTGTAQGMDQTKTYVSLIYDEASASSGLNACIPAQPPPPLGGGLTDDQMQLGDWQPIGNDGSGDRTLNAERRGDAHVSLSKIGTVSIRRQDPAGPLVALPLMACGAVEIQQQ